MSDLIVGIDLGTTNSEVAAFVDGKVRVLGPGETKCCRPASASRRPANCWWGSRRATSRWSIRSAPCAASSARWAALRPYRWATRSFTPQEISALILRELAEWASRELRQPVKRAVITVPAYFSDAQRNATREAGMMAGLEVVRILNEPTAASLAYGFGDGSRHTAMVYDLGGGTFDVSVVTVEGDVTEVLASHGNNHLGGDDFDDLLVEQLQAEFQKQHGVRMGAEHRGAGSPVVGRRRGQEETELRALREDP